MRSLLLWVLFLHHAVSTDDNHSGRFVVVLAVALAAQ